MIIPPQFQRRFSGLRGTLAFTLTELLIAAALTSTTLLVSGMGLSTMISSSTAVNESAERKDELNRAMDFIAAELREAEAINQEDIETVRNLPDYRLQLSSVPVAPNSIREVLWFEVNGEKIVYYVGSPTSDDGPWVGPQVVYRWGPTFQADGTYDSSRREHTLLIDSLDNQISGDPNNPICHSGWKPAFENPSGLGFFACIDTARKVATLVKVGRVDKVLGKSEPIFQRREVYSRAFLTPQASAPAPTGPGTTPPPPEGIGGDDEGFFLTQNVSQLVLENRGGAITCSAGGPTVATMTTVELTRPGETTEKFELAPRSSLVTQDLPQDSMLRFIVKAESCGGLTVDSKTDLNSQVLMLSDGQRIPFYEPFDNQKRIQEFLTEEELPEGSNVLMLPANRRVVLFEAGEAFSETPSPAYDFQDVVLVVDVKPELVEKVSETTES